MMRGAGALIRDALKAAAAAGLALQLAACGGGAPSATIVDLKAAKPAAAHALRGQIRIAQPTATADLSSERILVRETPLTLATLSGVRLPDTLPSLLRARLVQSFQNAHLTRYIASGAANPEYEL